MAIAHQDSESAVLSSFLDVVELSPRTVAISKMLDTLLETQLCKLVNIPSTELEMVKGIWLKVAF